MRHLICTGLAVFSLCGVVALTASAADGGPRGDRFARQQSWPSAGNGPADSHDAPDEFILGPLTKDYVHQRWVFTADGEVQSTPTVEGGNLYLSDAGGSVWRLDAASGRVIWKVRLPDITGNPKSYSRVSPALGPHTIIIGDQAAGLILALSKIDGRLVWQTTLATDQGAIITASPLVDGGRVYAGVSSNQESLAAQVPGFQLSFRGSVAALDLDDGHILWQTAMVPQGYTGGAVWGGNFALDRARHALYVTTGNNYSVPGPVAQCQDAAADPTALSACLPADDHIDSLLSLDSRTGVVNWARRLEGADTWTVSCLPSSQPPATPCPSPAGIDADFGGGANLFTGTIKGAPEDLVGAGQKTGVYWALDRDTGATVWATQVGPDGPRGGIEWGTATDGQRIYVPVANSAFVQTTLVPSGKQTNGGFWSALDVSTGQILWQTPTFQTVPPGGTPAAAMPESEGAVSVANGVLYGEDAAGHFVGLGAANGRVLRSFQSGGASIAAPAIVDGVLYWGSGYHWIGATNNKLYAFWTGLQ